MLSLISLFAGYDTGVMSSVLSLKSFKTDFGLPLATTGFASKTNAHISQNVVSLLTAGCFFGAIFASVANDKLGRKRALLGFTVVFLVGAVIQVTSLHHISQVYVGRFIAGLGIGGMSSITPIYVAENCPAEVRGRITGLFQEFLVIGSTFAYWLNYGVSLHLKPSTSQWRIPVGAHSEFLVRFSFAATSNSHQSRSESKLSLAVCSYWDSFS
jgi:MFS family permease